MDEKETENLESKLDILLKIFAYQTIKDIEDTKEKMWLLNTFGFSNDDIAKILDTTKRTIEARLSEVRASKKKGGKK